MFEMVAGCVVLTIAALVIRRRHHWSRAQRWSVAALCTASVAALAFAGAMGCAATHLERPPGDPYYCPNSTGEAWLLFSEVTAVAALAMLSLGAALAFVDRPRPRPVPAALDQPTDASQRS